MQRAVSLLLILFFGIGPLTATLQADDDSRLPACCRRHGAHHCVMSDAMMAAMVQAMSGTPAVSAPAHCPYYPGHNHATVASIYALAPRHTHSFALPGQFHLRVVTHDPLRPSPVRTHAGRGPPASLAS